MDKLDKFLRSKLDKADYSFKEEYWKDMESRLDAASDGRRRGLWWLWSGLAVLFLGVAIYFVLPSDASIEDGIERPEKELKETPTVQENEEEVYAFEEKSPDPLATDSHSLPSENSNMNSIRPESDETSENGSSEPDSDEALMAQGMADEQRSSTPSGRSKEKDTSGNTVPPEQSTFIAESVEPNTQNHPTGDLQTQEFIPESDTESLDSRVDRPAIAIAQLNQNRPDLLDFEGYAFSFSPDKPTIPSLPSHKFLRFSAKAFSYLPTGGGSLSHAPGFGGGLEVQFPLRRNLSVGLGLGAHVQDGGVAFQKESQRIELGFAANQQSFNLQLTRLYQAYADLTFDYQIKNHVVSLGGGLHYGYAGKGIIQSTSTDGLTGVNVTSQTKEWISLEGMQRLQPELFLAYGQRISHLGLMIQLGLHFQQQQLLNSPGMTSDYSFNGSKLRYYPRIALEYELKKLRLK